MGCFPTSRRRRGYPPCILCGKSGSWCGRFSERQLGPSFGKLYASEGRPSIPPEQLLSALLLQAFYAIRSERQLMEQLDYNLLYRWFVGLAPDDPVWDATTFTNSPGRCSAATCFRSS